MLQLVIHFINCRWSSSSKRSIPQTVWCLHSRSKIHCDILSSLLISAASLLCAAGIWTVAFPTRMWQFHFLFICQCALSWCEAFGLIQKASASWNLPISHHDFSHTNPTNYLVWNLGAQRVSGEKVKILLLSLSVPSRWFWLLWGVGGQPLT